MARFRNKPKEIEAEQFLPPHQIPPGVMNVYQMGDTFSGQVQTIQGERVNVKAGEWIVKEPNGINYYPISDEVFKKNYQPIE